MILRYTLFLLTVSTITALLPTHPAVANVDDDLCEPFEDAAIDESLIASMLRAADDGYLYRIKPDSSSMGFCINSAIGKVDGQFRDFNGGIALEGNDKQALVKVELDSLETDGALVEAMIKSETFFDVDSHPELLFVSTGFEWLSSSRGVLHGQLSLRGITRDIAFYVEISDNDDAPGDLIKVKASTTIQRSQFGMYSLGSLVSDRVTLCISAEAERYRAVENPPIQTASDSSYRASR